MYKSKNDISDQLIDRCKNGDEASCEILYNQYANSMYNTSLRIVNNSADAEDILQEAFTSAYKNLSKFENRSSFGAWLKKIVINRSINKIKREKWHWVNIETIEQQQDNGREEDTEDEINFKVTEIKAAISELPDGYRTVLCLYLLENYSHDEIAVLLKITNSTVRTQYIRAKKRLLEIIKKRNRL